MWTISLPLTVAVHVSQDAEGWATIIWDNSFYEVGRMPFTVPNAVSWSQMEWALSMRFNYQTGCTLNEEHLQYFCKYRINRFSTHNVQKHLWERGENVNCRLFQINENILRWREMGKKRESELLIASFGCYWVDLIHTLSYSYYSYMKKSFHI